MKMFNHQEYITLNEAINSCGGNKVEILDLQINEQAAIEETLKEIAIIQKSGKHVNSYRLLDSYRVSSLYEFLLNSSNKIHCTFSCLFNKHLLNTFFKDLTSMII